jgi:phosphate transport system substrate-binding protein
MNLPIRSIAGFGLSVAAVLFAFPGQAPAQVEAAAQGPATEKQATPAAASPLVDPKLPKYQPATGISGNLKSIGSDTMNKLMAYWAEGFRRHYPNVEVEIEGKGSSTAPPALISGTAQFGPMSRPMKAKEIDDFEKAHGYKPTEIPTSIDMLAVFVHKDNPIQSLTLEQVDAIFSSTRKRGLDRDLRTWGDLGLTGGWANQPLSLYGRNAASGTYGFFKEHALANGDFKDSVKQQPGSSSVVQGIASDKYAIGYSGIGYKTSDVRAVPLAKDAKSQPVAAEPQNAYSGTYPMARFLYVYVNHKPGTEMDPLRREFIRYMLSQEGQQDVVKDGYYPLKSALAEKALQKVAASK